MPISVLLAADLRLLRDWLGSELSSAGDLDVIGAAAGSTEAVALARRLGPDLLLFDRGMPDSLLAVREIQAEQPRIRSLAFGAHETEPEIAVCADAGVHGFIARDASPATLLESVRRVMRGEFVGSTAVSRLLLAHFARRRVPGARGPLTGREVEILRLIDLGHSNKEIAATAGITVATVKNHIHRVLCKLEVRRRSEAVAKWRRSGASSRTSWVPRRSG